MPAFLWPEPGERGDKHLDLGVLGSLFVEHEPGGRRGRGSYDMLGNLKADSESLKRTRVGDPHRPVVGRQVVHG